MEIDIELFLFILTFIIFLTMLSISDMYLHEFVAFILMCQGIIILAKGFSDGAFFIVMMIFVSQYLAIREFRNIRKKRKIR